MTKTKTTVKLSETNLPREVVLLRGQAMPTAGGDDQRVHASQMVILTVTEDDENPNGQRSNEFCVRMDPDHVVKVMVAKPQFKTDFKEDSVATICGHCNSPVTTWVKTARATKKAFLCSVVIAMFGGIFGCCLLPFTVKRFQVKKHFCPVCRQRVAVFKQTSSGMSCCVMTND